MARYEPTYSFDNEGRFVITNYNWSKPLSSFLPGIAGLWGIPSWCYFVNRNQLICSMGVEDKDGAMLEFLSFNQALNLVGQTGFRTFIRADDQLYELFKKSQSESVMQILRICPHELEIEEQNPDKGLLMRVAYFPLVELPIAGLVRRVQITNTHDRPQKVEIIDGVARMIPYGTTFEHQKVTARHIEAMMHVAEVSGVPVFKLKQTAADVAEIGEIPGMHFLISLRETGDLENQGPIIDPRLVFGDVDQLSRPWEFEDGGIDELLGREQISINQTPCAFSAWKGTLKPGETASYSLILGHAKTQENLEQFVTKINQPGFLARQRQVNQDLIELIGNKAATVSANPQFDAYCEQTFLDNVVRGGQPFMLGDPSDPTIIQVFGRQNADLERDYHWLELEADYLSQGNGHYRSVLQNRRMDPWFFPWSGDFVIRQFINLIQLDGYNPLDVKAQRFQVVEEKAVSEVIEQVLPEFDRDSAIATMLREGFSPGALALALHESTQIDPESLFNLLGKILEQCKALEIGALHVGYWVDHWLYNLDSIEVFLSIYPDRLIDLLIGSHDYTFFDNPDVVQPRALKVFEVEGLVRRYEAVTRDTEKEERISKRKHDPYKVRTKKGDIYRTSLFVKLICMVATKFAALDPMWIGVEMEADKPGWNDSLNGLPGMFGSSLCQSLVLIRAFRFLLSASEMMHASGVTSVKLFVELAELIRNLNHLAETVTTTSSVKERFLNWDARQSLLEEYRAKTRQGVDGKEVSIGIEELSELFTRWLQQLDGIYSLENDHGVLHENGVPYTYFRYDASEYQVLDKKTQEGWTPVKVLAFDPQPVALFLEGAVHYIRTYPERTRNVYESVRGSELFDQTLGMFRICEVLDQEPPELGRITAYPPGWLEHASIYTHMSFKWLLELLRAEHYEAFFDTLKTSLPPFMKPEIYGRSTFENSSFIVSSAYPDSRLHGQAFQPRLSGVTAEWLQIWTLMVAGPKPFILRDNGELVLAFKPALPDWLFTMESRRLSKKASAYEVEVPPDSFAFVFLGQVFVTYHNPTRKSTWGSDPATIKSGTFEYVDGRKEKYEGSTYSGQVVLDVREGRVRRIDLMLG